MLSPVAPRTHKSAVNTTRISQKSAQNAPAVYARPAFYLTVDTLYVSFVSPGCLQEPKIARITVAAGRSDLLIMG